MNPTKYRKKPVVIEAVKHSSTSAQIAKEIADWCGGKAVKNEFDHGSHILIETLEGTMKADLGDWIIKGVKDEFYPCKNEIFLATYEPAEDEGVQGLRQEEAP